MASNVTTMSWTKHVNIRYNNGNKYVNDGIVKIICENSAVNNIVVLTKNLS